MPWFSQSSASATPSPPRDDAARLRALLAASQPSGLEQLVSAFGGVDRCYRCFLGAAGKPDPAAAAAANIESTLAYRKQYGLDAFADAAALTAALDAHSLRPHLPVAFAGTAPDGCVIQYLRFSQVGTRELASAGDSQVCGLVALWLELALRLQADSCGSSGHCPGTYDIYDMKGVNSWSLLWEAKATRGALGPVFRLGEANYPNNLYKCFVINAGSVMQSIWQLCAPFLSKRTQAKVSISTTVPAELVTALGGEEKVSAVMASVPP